MRTFNSEGRPWLAYLFDDHISHPIHVMRDFIGNFGPQFFECYRCEKLHHALDATTLPIAI
jgi:hypothetical protein